MRRTTLMAFAALLPGACGGDPTPGPAADASMIHLGPATFLMGTEGEEIPRLMARFGVGREALFASERPRHSVELEAFEIDRFEVTNRAFRSFVDAVPEWGPGRVPDPEHNGRYLEHWVDGVFPPGEGEVPVTFVTWDAAAAFCHWAGQRLPTEAEWEFAARGGQEGDVFPWGDAFPTPDHANWSGAGFGRAVAVGSYPPNPFGLFDMAGNVWEYVSDTWRDSYRDPEPPASRGPPGEGRGEVRKVIRGGSWGGAPVNLRVRYRDSHSRIGAGDHVGFRCAR